MLLQRSSLPVCKCQERRRQNSPARRAFMIDRLKTKGISPGIIQRQYVPASCATDENLDVRHQHKAPRYPVDTAYCMQC